MKKKTVVLLLLVALVIAVGTYGWVRLSRRGTDIIGVTTLLQKNKVIFNSASGDEFSSGSGTLTVDRGEHIHVEYDLTAGSIDVAFYTGDRDLSVFREADLSALTPEGEVFGKSGVSGSGSLDFAAESGEYTVYIVLRGGVGNAVITAAAG